MKIFSKILKWIRNTVLGLFLLSLLLVVAYRFVPVYFTPLMFVRVVEQVKEKKPITLKHRWVPLKDISQQLVQAVVASEDNLFLVHKGFDYEQIKLARNTAKKGGKVRGASTITQQTAKNIFLWHGKSYLRKGLEAYFTVLMEFIWGKERIMEVYLNSIEMGSGIYGAEAVAKAHFSKPASALTKSEAALIAATLPNPRRFNSSKPSPYVIKRQSKIMSLMDKIIKVNFGTDKPEKVKEKPSSKKRKKWRA